MNSYLTFRASHSIKLCCRCGRQSPFTTSPCACHWQNATTLPVPLLELNIGTVLHFLRRISLHFRVGFRWWVRRCRIISGWWERHAAKTWLLPPRAFPTLLIPPPFHIICATHAARFIDRTCVTTALHLVPCHAVGRARCADTTRRTASPLRVSLSPLHSHLPHHAGVSTALTASLP